MSVTFDQYVHAGNNGAGPTQSTTLPLLNTHTGDSIVVFIRNASAAEALTQITDTVGNTYSKVTAASLGNANGDYVQTWLCNNSTGANATNVITIGNGGTDSFSSWGIMGLQFNGTAATPLDVTDALSTNSTAAPTSNAFSTTIADEAVVFAMTSRGNPVTAASCGGSAASFQTPLGFGPETGCAYQIQTSVQSGITDSFACSASGNAVVVTISLKGIAAAITAAVPPPQRTPLGL